MAVKGNRVSLPVAVEMVRIRSTTDTSFEHLLTVLLIGHAKAEDHQDVMLLYQGCLRSL